MPTPGPTDAPPAGAGAAAARIVADHPVPADPTPFYQRAFESLRVRDFRIFYAGQLVSITGTWMQQVAIGWLVLDLTGSPFLLGVATAARSLPVLLLSFAGGIAADRFPRRVLLLLANGAAAVLSAVLAILTLAGTVDVAAIVALAFLLGVTSAVELPARQSYFVELVGRGQLMNAIALNSLVVNGSRIVGPAIAGILIATFGAGSTFAVNAVSYGPVIVGLLLIRTRPEARLPMRVRGALGEAVGYLRREPRVASLLGLIATSTVFATGHLTLGPAIARNLGQGPEGLGLLLSATGIGAVAAGLVLATRLSHEGRASILFAAALVTAGTQVGVALSGSFALTLLLLGGTGWGMVTTTATSNTLIQAIVPDGLRGRVMSLYTMVLLGFMPVGALFSGTVAGLAGTAFAIGLGAVLWAIAVVLVFLRSASLRSL